jgi:hypothetical protein
MPRLVYVDEQDDQRNAMRVAALLSDEFLPEDVEVLDPCPSLADMLHLIDEHQPDVLVTDYRLSEQKAGVTYNGAELAAAYLDKYEGFPCFVTTGFAADAAEHASSEVINIIFSKDDAQADEVDEADVPFFKRVRLKIDAYKRERDALTARVRDLQQASSERELDPHELEELLRLDGKLEAMVGKEYALSDDLKKLALKPLTSIFEEAEKLLEKLEQANDSSSEGTDSA